MDYFTGFLLFTLLIGLFFAIFNSVILLVKYYRNGISRDAKDPIER